MTVYFHKQNRMGPIFGGMLLSGYTQISKLALKETDAV
jgi:ribulose 1,5-bisphosphate synthetase/thiazole synthase